MNKLIATYLKNYIDKVFENESLILSKYKENASELIEVSITDERIKYVFLAYDGASIVDSITHEEYDALIKSKEFDLNKELDDIQELLMK